MFPAKHLRLSTVTLVGLTLLNMWVAPVFSEPALGQAFKGNGRWSSRWPLEVRASISPEPIVGREVVWHIEIASSGPEFPNTKLQAALPEGVELVSGNPNWQGDIPVGGKVTVDLVIRVKMPGEWKLMARASVNLDNQLAYGIEKSLYVTSTTTSAEVVEDVNRSTAVIPILQIAPVISSTAELRTALQPESVGGTLTISGNISFNATVLSPDPANPSGYLISSKIQPLRRVRVEAWDQNTAQPAIYNFLSVKTYTNSAGGYTLVISNVDPDGDGTGIDLRLRIYSTDDERVEVRNGNANSFVPYGLQINVGDNLADGTQSFSYIAGSSLSLEPWFIHDLIANTGYDYLRNNTTWVNTNKVIVRWPTACIPLTTPSSCYYFGTVHLVQSDGWDSDAILHEYSHFALSRAEYYGDNPVVFACQGVGFVHNFQQHTNPSCAWSEGWADFLQAAMQNDGNYFDTGYPSSSSVIKADIESPVLAALTSSNTTLSD